MKERDVWRRVPLTKVHVLSRIKGLARWPTQEKETQVHVYHGHVLHGMLFLCCQKGLQRKDNRIRSQEINSLFV